MKNLAIGSLYNNIYLRLDFYRRVYRYGELNKIIYLYVI